MQIIGDIAAEFILFSQKFRVRKAIPISDSYVIIYNIAT